MQHKETHFDQIRPYSFDIPQQRSDGSIIVMMEHDGRNSDSITCITILFLPELCHKFHLTCQNLKWCLYWLWITKNTNPWFQRCPQTRSPSYTENTSFQPSSISVYHQIANLETPPRYQQVGSTPGSVKNPPTFSWIKVPAMSPNLQVYRTDVINVSVRSGLKAFG